MTLRWPSRIAAFALWALAALSAVYWLLKVLGVSEAPVTAGAISAEAPAANVQHLALALGPDPAAGIAAAAPGAPPPQQAQDPRARMRLLGVVAGRRSGGVALISIEGQPPRAYRVGSPVDAGHTLTRVATRSATLSPAQPGGQAFTLELPAAVATETQARPIAVDRPALDKPPAGRLPGLAQGNPRQPLAIPGAATPANSATNAAGAEQPKD